LLDAGALLGPTYEEMSMTDEIEEPQNEPFYVVLGGVMIFSVVIGMVSLAILAFRCAWTVGG
jgi:hypothetical protein